MIKKTIDWLFPQCCCVCQTEISRDSIFCSKCFSEIIFIDVPICSRCGKMLTVPLPPEEEQICDVCFNTNEIFFDISRSLFLYNNFSRRIIFRIKKRADVEIIRACVRMLINRYGPIVRDIDFIVPVPSHWTRNLLRGYNPSRMIAEEFSKILCIPIDDGLKRIRRTEYQRGKTAKERVRNVESAFTYRGNLKDKRILLIDDVMTTGATLNECSRTLKMAGSPFVMCMNLATTSITDPIKT